MTIIAPSILSADFLNLKDEIKAFDGIPNLWLHLDMMDGHFVPNLTFGATVLKGLKNITKQKLDAHFMVTNPEDYISQFLDIGIHNFTFHWEATTHHDRLISEIKKNYPSVGISLNPSTNINVIPEYLLSKVDLILLMSVNPGFGGQSFIEGTFDKVRVLAQIRSKLNLDFKIQIDGGVSDQNAKDLINAGADSLVAGSFIFKAGKENYKSQINKLLK